MIKTSLTVSIAAALLTAPLCEVRALDMVPWYEGVASVTTVVPGAGNLSSTARFNARGSKWFVEPWSPEKPITNVWFPPTSISTISPVLTVLFSSATVPANGAEVERSLVKVYQWTEPVSAGITLPPNVTPETPIITLPAFRIKYFVETGDGSRYPAEYLDSQNKVTVKYTVPELPAEGQPTKPYAVITIRLSEPQIIDLGGRVPPGSSPTPTPQPSATPAATPEFVSSPAPKRPKPNRPRPSRDRR